MYKLRIHTLGRLQIFLEGELIKSFDTDKVCALLAYLAVETGGPHRRELLAGLLWSDQPEERAFHSLRQALSGLRRALGEKATHPSRPGDPPIILAIHDTLVINPEISTWLDIKDFEALLARAYQHYQRSNRTGRLNIRRLKQATDLYRGPFLDQFYLKGSPQFEAWAMIKREYIDQRMIEALSFLVDYYERRGENILARQTAQRLAQLAPWEETACSRIVHLLVLEGHWSAALAQAQNFVQYLAEELNVEPSPEMQALIENVQTHAMQFSAPAQPFISAPNNLPLPDTPFIGRQIDLDQLSDLLADPCCRLVTLTGMGGIGKTRLALEAAAEQAGLYKDGVYFVPLTDANNLAEWTTVVANAVGFRFFGDRPPPEQLKGYLNAKDVLLVLDNFEHLLSAGPEENGIIPFLLDILKGSERLKVLVTSRVPLNLRLERVVELAGLDCPADTSSQSDEHFGAIDLFEQTARHMQPQFSVTSEWPVVVQICRLLEGVPLAIELSAPWVRAQACADILAEIQADMDNLSTSMQDVTPRHRSMRTVFDHSWRLLSGAEQEAFKRLAIFRGGFDLQAAMSVAGAPVGLVGDLAQKSLLHRVGPDHYDLHGLVQRFAAEKLAADEPAARETAERYAANYVNFLVSHIVPLKSAGQQQALAEMDQELENWRLAWEWLVDQDRAAEILRCSETIFHYYNIRAGFQEGITLFKKAAARLEADPQHAAPLGRLLTYLGALAYRARDDELCQAALERARRVLENGPDTAGLALCLVVWAGMLSRKKEYAAAFQTIECSIALYRQRGDIWGESYALYLLGFFYNRKGMTVEAEAVLKASLEAARQSGDMHRQINPLNLLGDDACMVGAYDLAIQYFEASLAICRTIRDRYNEALVGLNLGTVYHVRQQFAEARRLYDASLEICRDIGDIAGQAMALSNLGELVSDCGEYHEALPFFEQGLALSRAQFDDWSEISCLNNLVKTCIELDDLPSAETHIEAALRLSAGLDAPPIAAITLLHLARLRLRQGNKVLAAKLLSVVLHVGGIEEDIRQKALQVLASIDIPVPETSARSLEEVLAGLLSELELTQDRIVDD